MRGGDKRQDGLFSYVSLEARVPANHPLRTVRTMVDEALKAMSRDFGRLYSLEGRPSIAPEQLLRALLLQVFYSIRSERLLIEELDYNLLYRWFVGLSADAPPIATLKDLITLRKPSQTQRSAVRRPRSRCNSSAG